MYRWGRGGGGACGIFILLCDQYLLFYVLYSMECQDHVSVTLCNNLSDLRAEWTLSHTHTHTHTHTHAHSPPPLVDL